VASRARAPKLVTVEPIGAVTPAAVPVPVTELRATWLPFTRDPSQVHQGMRARACAAASAAVVPATEVARRLGHSVAVSLKVYATWIDGEEEQVNVRIEAALGATGGRAKLAISPSDPVGDVGETAGPVAGRIGHRAGLRGRFRRWEGWPSGRWRRS
jgi:hypothetical protein